MVMSGVSPELGKIMRIMLYLVADELVNLAHDAHPLRPESYVFKGHLFCV